MFAGTSFRTSGAGWTRSCSVPSSWSWWPCLQGPVRCQSIERLFFVLMSDTVTAVAGLALANAPDFAHYLSFLQPIVEVGGIPSGLATTLAPAAAAAVFISLAVMIASCDHSSSLVRNTLTNSYFRGNDSAGHSFGVCWAVDCLQGCILDPDSGSRRIPGPRWSPSLCRSRFRCRCFRLAIRCGWFDLHQHTGYAHMHFDGPHFPCPPHAATLPSLALAAGRERSSYSQTKFQR